MYTSMYIDAINYYYITIFIIIMLILMENDQ